MILPNIYFQDYPIEFKEINPEDFPNCEVENDGRKIIITPDSNGYITNELLSVIDKNVKNTVVVNAAVGQGKTTAIIESIKQFYSDTTQNFIIIVASPYVSLVEQYFNEISKVGIPEHDIYRYEFIGEHPDISYLDKKIHIITINSILGNPGNDAFINSEKKRNYLKNLSDDCKLRGKKVIFIMDEIHDAIHNFKQEYIFNLWKWKEVLHKIIILSATYNEASKVVIDYLTELTDNKLKIIESKRIILSENQSKLYLHFNPATYYLNSNTNIAEVIKDLISRGKEVDILCYSKNLAENIVKDKDSGIGEVLYSKYDKINKCTSELILNNRIGRLEHEDVFFENRFDNTQCNVGTNFKTGINISKRNHAFIIILPPKGSKLPFSSAKGIFSNGINSIIQALARQRKRGGEIHLILPPPEKFNYDTLPFDGEQKEIFIKFYDHICDFEEVKTKVSYIPINRQKELVYYFFNDVLKENIRNEIELVNNEVRVDKPSLKMPDFKTYLLTTGEKYLSSSFKFFGEDLSSYITYCAITNQFINCKFAGYSHKDSIYFKEGQFQLTLELFFNNYFIDEARDFIFKYTSDMYRYFELKNHLFEYYKLILISSEGKFIRIKKDKSRIFELQLLGFIHRIIHPAFNSNYLKDNDVFDYKYSRGEYFSSCIVKAQKFRTIEIMSNNRIMVRVLAYKSLAHFREKLISSIETFSGSSKPGYQYVYNKPRKDFVSALEEVKFNNMIDFLINEDYFISRDIFEFKQRFKASFSLKTKIVSFYRKLIEDFLVTEDSRLPTGARQHIKIVKSIKSLPEIENAFDSIGNGDYNFPEAFLKSVIYESKDGKLVKKTS